MSMVMGKGGCLHALAQPAQQGAQLLDTLSRDKHQQGHEPRWDGGGLFCHDVVSPLGGLFWGREREPLTLA